MLLLRAARAPDPTRATDATRPPARAPAGSRARSCRPPRSPAAATGAAGKSRREMTSTPLRNRARRSRARASDGSPRRHVGQALELDADEVELVLVPAHPDAEREAAAGELLQRRDLLRQVHRVVQRHEHDRRAEPDSLRPARDPAQRDERVVDTAIRVDRLGADDDVLRRPRRVEVELLGELRDATNGVDRRTRAVVRQDHTVVHDARLTAARVARLATTDPDGRPHLVPIVFALDGDTLYSAVDRKPKRSSTLRRIENARVRPDVAILVDHYEDDWDRLWWIRLRG